MHDGRDPLDLLRRLVTAALDSEEGRPVAPVDLDAELLPAIVQAVRRHRVPELLRDRAGVLGLGDDLTASLDRLIGSGRRRLQLQTLETVRATSLLRRRGIDVLAFKGLALALQTTGTASARGPGDVDLLVAPGDVAEVHRTLGAAGWALHQCGQVEPDTWAWRHVARWGSALTYIGDGADVDLHWRFESAPGARPRFDELWARREEVLVGGAPVATLDRADAFHHLAGHREGWTWMRTLVDLRRLARDPAVLDAELSPLAAVSLAVAREAVGLPADVPGRVHDRLDRVPSGLLVRARAHLGLSVTSDFGGGSGTALALRNNLVASRSLADVAEAAVIAVLPAHAALPVRAPTAWTGIPLALGLRLRNLVRGLLVRAGLCAPCAPQPARAA